MDFYHAVGLLSPCIMCVSRDGYVISRSGTCKGEHYKSLSGNDPQQRYAAEVHVHVHCHSNPPFDRIDTVTGLGSVE